MENYIIGNLSAYIGESDIQLKKRFSINKRSNKSTLVEIAYKMAGVSSNRLQELKDDNIIIKTIRINSSGKIVESMSFPTIKFTQLVSESWSDSFIYNYFNSMKFIFVVYKEVDFGYQFLGGIPWMMPSEDLENIVKKEWQEIQDTIKAGLRFKIIKGVVSNNLPKKSQTKIIHLRPKASKSAYLLDNGYSCGNVKKDGDQLPNGEWMTKQCFWLNNDYVLKQIENKSLNVKYINSKLTISEKQCSLLKKNLDQNFYLINDFKRFFLSALGIDDERYINALNLHKVGYNFCFDYVYSNDFENINKYVESIILGEEMVDLRKIEPNLLKIANIDDILDESIKTLPIIRVQRYEFISKDRLYNSGFSEAKFRYFADEISSKYEDYFTIHSLRKNHHIEFLFDDGFENCFYEDILTCSGKFKSFVVDGLKVFCGLNMANSFLDYLKYVVGRVLKVEINELIHILNIEYGLNVDENDVRKTLRYSDLYFNKDIQKVYSSHDVFIQEVKTLY